MKYDNLCEMKIGELMNSLMGQVDALGLEKEQDSCTIQNPIQPDDNIGEFGNTPDIHVKISADGGVEVDSKEMAVKLSKNVFEAIKSFLNKGE